MHALEMCGPRKSASPCGPHGSAWGLLQISPAARDGPANQMTLCSIKTALSTVHRSLSSTLPSTVLHEPSAVLAWVLLRRTYRPADAAAD